ncbi:hypothetical protein HDU96_000164 [Phlyctochytrium bullatum]|nr:hypothetical protein HDU96_000164 [Phlyctochytrium bullatum]
MGKKKQCQPSKPAVSVTVSHPVASRLTMHTLFANRGELAQHPARQDFTIEVIEAREGINVVIGHPDDWNGFDGTLEEVENFDEDMAQAILLPRNVLSKKQREHLVRSTKAYFRERRIDPSSERRTIRAFVKTFHNDERKQIRALVREPILEEIEVGCKNQILRVAKAHIHNIYVLGIERLEDFDPEDMEGSFKRFLYDVETGTLVGEPAGEPKSDSQCSDSESVSEDENRSDASDFGGNGEEEGSSTALVSGMKRKQSKTTVLSSKPAKRLRKNLKDLARLLRRGATHLAANELKNGKNMKSSVKNRHEAKEERRWAEGDKPVKYEKWVQVITHRGQFVSTQASSWVRYRLVTASAPHLSKDFQTEACQAFMRRIEQILLIVSERIRKLLPRFAAVQAIVNRVMERVRGFGLAVPGGMFGGMSINYNISTQLHKDADDLPNGWCLILPYGNYSGGDLNMVETGYRLKVAEGELALFRSNLLTHGNEGVRDERLALVFYTCANLYRWALFELEKNGPKEDFVLLREWVERGGYDWRKGH